jgi:D-serine deaminase-like pyridoxal phosphate-dependent protein
MKLLDLETPCLIVNLDALERNIQRMSNAARSARLALRPHIKTHKTAEVTRMQLAAGAAGVTVATVSEAEAMAQAGARDILIGNQITGPESIRRAIELARTVSLAVVVDSTAIARPIAAAAAAAGMRLPVLLEVDTGCHRCGVAPEAADATARELAAVEGLELVGLFTYPGHARRTGSAEGARKVAAQEAAELRRLADQVTPTAPVGRWLSGGSTLTATLYEPGCGLTEIRPGTYVYNDLRMVDLGCAATDDCAQTVLASVISDRGHYVVVNAGSKCLTTDPPYLTPGHGRLKGVEGAYVETLYEEHGCVKAPEGGRRLKVGDKVEIIPNHACVVSNLFSSAVAVRGDEVVERWPILARR